MDPNMDLTYHETMKIITAYKRHPILWNPHVLGYYNKKERDLSWKIVASESGKAPYICKKKINTLMTSCRRVKQKIIDSRRSGRPEDVVMPSWRYWNTFKFLRGLEDNEDDPLGTAPEMDILDPSVCSTKSDKKKSKSDNKDKSIGKICAEKMRKMYSNQKQFTRNLIHEILDMGLANSLTSRSKIVSPVVQTPVEPVSTRKIVNVDEDTTKPILYKKGKSAVYTSNISGEPTYVIWSQIEILNASPSRDIMEYLDLDIDSKTEMRKLKRKMKKDPLRNDSEDSDSSQGSSHTLTKL